MTSTHDTDVLARPASDESATSRRLRVVVGVGLIATLAAVTATTTVAALARAVGVDFVVQDGETIPLSGISFVTGFFSAVGVGVAAAFRRWSSARAAERFVRTTVSLAAISLVPPFLSGGDAATVATLIGLHLVAASVMIPALARSLGRPD